MNGQLRAGTQLRERQIAAIFGVTRGCIRKVLHRLGHEGRLDLLRNRGAFVPRPSIAEAEKIYEARRALEAGIVAVLASRIVESELQSIRRHLQAERDAAQSGRRNDSVKLAGDFHLLLADILGNGELTRSLAKLVSRTQLMVSLYEPPASSICAVDEHERIFAALERRDPPAAMQQMIGHLTQVESRVTASRNSPKHLSLDEIFAEAAASTAGQAVVRSHQRRL